jgi:hypothetical protein
LGQWIEFVASIDFDSQYLNAGIAVPGLTNYQGGNTVFSIFSDALSFDINTKFYFCSDIPSLATTSNFQCLVKTLNIWYTSASLNTGAAYFGGLSRNIFSRAHPYFPLAVLLAYYAIDEGTGTQLQDSTGNYPAGTFGTTILNPS